MLARWNYTTPSLWNELSRFNREMERLFGGASSSTTTGVFPPLNMYDTGDALVVRAEMPGVATADLDIQANLSSLTIKGERKAPRFEKETSHHRRERGYGVFSRTIALPQEIDPDKVSANYKDGILEVTLPRAEAVKPRRIEIGG